MPASPSGARTGPRMLRPPSGRAVPIAGPGRWANWSSGARRSFRVPLHTRFVVMTSRGCIHEPHVRPIVRGKQSGRIWSETERQSDGIGSRERGSNQLGSLVRQATI